MLVYANASQRLAPAAVAEHARRAEAMGYDGLNLPEAVHDGVIAATLALQGTQRIRVATSVLVAFARSPMAVAMAAWDLQSLSGGRFELGLGAQVRGNVEDRYGVAWSPPIERMREFVGALRATFACWADGTPLCFEGEHYRLTRMQPFFAPEKLASAPPPVILGAVGPKMIALAGEVADGLVTHPTNTHPRYLREVIRPRLAHGAARAGREASSIVLKVAPICATGRDDAAVRTVREEKRKNLAFLFSTPAYWPSLELFGWRERGEELHRRTREKRWSEMTDLVTDEMLDAFVPSAPYEDLPAVLREWYGGLADVLVFPVPEDPSDDAAAARAIAALR
ncbi:MAG: TIGR03617 family F420-dependent LLM class oxidoreductase [Deltaproteobacteria bacterium]|nr:TIGR03617 family F420-dependent LLM class oxidoreductase [Deltaproteobacteria bacterium]